MEIIRKRKKHKFKWNKYKVVVLICFIIFICGFFTVSNSLPKFVKDKSSFSVYFSRKPFDFRIKSKNYTFYVNYKVLDNIRDFNKKVIIKSNCILSYVKDFFVTISKNINEHVINIKKTFSNIFITEEVNHRICMFKLTPSYYFMI